MTDQSERRRPRPGELAARYPAVLAVVAGGVTGGLVAVADPAIGGYIAAATAVGIGVVEAIGMLRDLRSGRWGLDVLALLAIGSTVAVGEHWAALVVALMITGGEALEDYASARARRQVTALLSRAPRIARLVRDGTVVEVPVEGVLPDAELLVTPGELVPVDGELLDAGEFDESSITGESLPVSRGPGEIVPSGSVNGGTAVRMRAVAAAADSQYQRIVALVEGAAGSRSRYVRIADRVAVPFTVVAVTIAVAAWLISGDPVRLAEVLVLATPCPLLIAAPAAFVAGMGRAARDGVIVKDGETLERLASVRTVAIDKTGTLTVGRPVVVRVESAPDRGEDEVLSLAAGLETSSNHVLARAIVDAAADRGISAPRVAEVTDDTGFGLHGTLDGRTVAIGRIGHLPDLDGAPGPGAGESVVVVAVDGVAVGRIVVRDVVRPDAADAVAELVALGGGRVMMLTGDLEATARPIAAAVGIGEVHAELRPADKARLVAEVPDRPVLMIGDGVNDAPVLAAADVGVAMGAQGATAAGESADAVVLVDALTPVPAAVRTARRTRRIASESIAIGIGLSLLGMVVAAFGVVPALAGALVQEAIDVVTILNGLRAAGGRRQQR